MLTPVSNYIDKIHGKDHHVSLILLQVFYSTYLNTEIDFKLKNEIGTTLFEFMFRDLLPR